jgi:hypothetical protein
MALLLALHALRLSPLAEAFLGGACLVVLLVGACSWCQKKLWNECSGVQGEAYSEDALWLGRMEAGMEVEFAFQLQDSSQHWLLFFLSSIFLAISISYLN